MNTFDNTSREVTALLAAIRKNPDDETSRLVLADWLQEQGFDDTAALWRGGAKKWLEEFAAKAGKDWDGLELSYDDVVRAGREWLQAGEDISEPEDGEDDWNDTCRNRAYRNAGWFSSLQHDGADGLMDDPATCARYWQCLEVVLGCRIEDSEKDNRIYSCTC